LIDGFAMVFIRYRKILKFSDKMMSDDAITY